MTKPNNLTPAQQRVYDEIYSTGFVECSCTFGRSQQNRPAQKLVDLGLAVVGWGPKSCALRTQGFMPAAGVADE